jgi:hypothetical protein
MKPLLFLLLIVLVTSCFDDEGNYIRTTDTVPITEISIPDSSIVGDTIQITAKAEANNGCWSNLRFLFDSVETRSYALQAIGRYESSGTCPQVIVSSDTVLNLITSQKGSYYIYVKRNPFTVQTDSINVKDTL